jgi:hypothetical protein
VSAFRLLGPHDGDTLSTDGGVTTMWIPPDERGVEFFRVEVATEAGDALFGALLPRISRRYDVPAWALAKGAGKLVRWRVSALGASGTVLRSSAWRRVRNGATLPSPNAHSVLRRDEP